MQTQRSNERGSASLKFMLVMLIIGTGAYAGYLYVPVAYGAHSVKDMMQHYVDVASADGKPPSWAAEQIVRNFKEYGIPANALMSNGKRDNRIEVRIQYVTPVEFPGYTYNYEFDYTARSTALLDFSK
jgi:hypothetical protein